MLPCSEVAAPGRTIDLAIFDEARSIPDEIFELVRPAAATGKTLAISNPGDPAGWFFELVNSPQPEHFIRSYPGILNPCLPPGFVEAERRRLFARGQWGELVFAREWEARWVRIAESPLILGEHVEAAERAPGHDDLTRCPENEAAYIGVDLSLTNDLTSIVVISFDSSRSIPYRIEELVVMNPKDFENKTIPLEKVERIIFDLAQKHSPIRIVVDRYQSQQLVQRLQRQGLNISDLQPTLESNYRCFSRLRDLVHDGKIVWERNERLRNELLNLTISETPTGFRVTDSKKKYHRDLSFSLAVAVDAAATDFELFCPLELLS